jgi:hypothetical protein
VSDRTLRLGVVAFALVGIATACQKPVSFAVSIQTCEQRHDSRAKSAGKD